MRTSVALLTADLRLHDNPVLHGAASEAGELVPLFVVDSGIAASGFCVPNRAAFLADCLADLDDGLRSRDGRLIVRSGEVVDQVLDVVAASGAGSVHVAGGPSWYALQREQRLQSALETRGVALTTHVDATGVVPPGAVLPAGRDHYAVFTPYLHRWLQEPVREPLPSPGRLTVPPLPSEPLPDAAALASGAPSSSLPMGGETAGRARLDVWQGPSLAAYDERHDALDGDGTSRLSPHLHFGCLSPVEVMHRARLRGGPGAEAFARQLAWRDFHMQVLAARPETAWHDYRPRGDRWRHAPDELAAWQEGRTGYPVVDAGMRQLRHEGWMHNRARLLTASFLTKTLYIDWRLGARHFLDLLVDGDVASNQLNWQWVAGTGTDTRPNRVLNPLAQARRFDPVGDYVRRWVPELAELPPSAIHRPWTLGTRTLRGLGYPPPMVDLGDALARFRRTRR